MLTGNDLSDYTDLMDNIHKNTQSNTHALAQLTKKIESLLHTPSAIPEQILLKSYNEWMQCISKDHNKIINLHKKIHSDLFSFESHDNKQFMTNLWMKWPYALIEDSYKLVDSWRHELFEDVDGLSEESKQVMKFLSDQAYASLSPKNTLATNPEALKRTIEERGANLLRGAKHMLEDWQAELDGATPPSELPFQPGKDVALTPGKVVFRNKLIELIQYSPATETVSANPILIVPAWIMKFYILDLSAHNSMVKYLVEQGHTVYIASWLNPQEEDRNLCMDDYIRCGFLEAVDTISDIQPNTKIQAVGYCIGGTLASIGAAVMARENDDRLQSLSLFTAQTDFAEGGEIRLFINDFQLNSLEEMMQAEGYLDSKYMGGSFAALRPEAQWSAMVQKYIHGERPKLNDLMSWNSDGTRMPAAMHSEYLRKLYQNNDLAEGKFEFEGKHVSINDITIPAFIVGTSTDHVAPWKSVYKIDQQLGSEEVSFLLTSGGHNAGIICGPSHPRRKHQLFTRHADDASLSPENWLEIAPHHEGSWWPNWNRWLIAHSDGEVPATAELGSAAHPPLCDAPGTYVFG